MALSLANTLKLADTIAYALYSVNQTLVVNTNSSITTILNGLANGSPSMVNDIVNFLDATSETALLPVASQTATNVSAQLVQATNLPTYYPNYYALLDLLETLTGGLAAYLSTNASKVGYSFAAVFNSYATFAQALNYRPSSYAVQAIAASQTFVDASTDLGSVKITGSTIVPIGTLDGTKVTPAPLFYRISSTGTGGRATTSTIQVTYVPSLNATPVNVSFTPSTSLTLNTKVSLGVSGLSVTAISVTSTGDDANFTYSISAEPIRTLTY